MPRNTNTVERSTDYGQFKFLFNNREAARSHIEALKRAFEEHGNITEVQPILVNERMEVIDGQHRFMAVQELGEPVFYTVRPGLTIQEARQMNILHRSWSTNDYAQSYAASGDPNYQLYLQLKETYGFNHTIMIAMIHGQAVPGAIAEFRRGELVIPDEDLEEIEKRCEEFLRVANLVGPELALRPFAFAYLKVRQSPEFNPDRFLAKLRQFGADIRSYNTIGDNMRQMEEIYNYHQTASGRVRLY